MSERLPRLTAKQIIKVLERRGFSLSRTSGSHYVYKDSLGRRTTVPYHASKTIHPKVLQSILRDIDCSAEQLKDELGR